MDSIKHLEAKFSIASYELIKECDAWELRFYLWLKLWAINKHSAFPGVKTIADDLGYSERQVQRMIKEMEGKKRLLVIRRDGQTNIYDITYYDRLLTNMSPGGDKSVTTTQDRYVTLTNRNKLKESNNSIKNFSTKVDNSVHNSDKYPKVNPEVIDKTRKDLVNKGFLPR